MLASTRQLPGVAFYLCYRIFVGGGVLDAPPGAAKK